MNRFKKVLVTLVLICAVAVTGLVYQITQRPSQEMKVIDEEHMQMMPIGSQEKALEQEYDPTGEEHGTGDAQ